MREKSLAASPPCASQSTRKLSHSRRASSDKPTPLEFDTFVPWMCLEWQCPVTVIVTRLLQEEYKKSEHRHSTSSRVKSAKSLHLKPEDIEQIGTKTNAATSGLTVFTSNNENSVPVKAYYDAQNHLVEISIIGCSIVIHRKVIQAISLCLPFHSLLTKLSIRKGGVTCQLLGEIGKLLPHSNLTDVCLDDTVVPGGNYYVIFEQTSQLKNLSLNRCSIDDAMCKSLADKIDLGSSGSSLLSLELGSNVISDEGTKALGEVLRRNRHLLHLNLSGNRITDDGASSILAHLVEFPLTMHEIYKARYRKLEYTENKVEVYQKCLGEVTERKKSEQIVRTSIKGSLKSKSIRKKKSPSAFIEEKSSAEVAEAMTLELVGEYSDPFDDNSICKKENTTYAKGNLVLCSLNLAYNNLTYRSIKMIYQVFAYQDQLVKSTDMTGLIRIVFEGNYIPSSSVEYDGIVMYMKKVINERVPLDTPYNNKRTTSASSSRRS